MSSQLQMETNVEMCTEKVTTCSVFSQGTARLLTLQMMLRAAVGRMLPMAVVSVVMDMT